MITRLKNLKGWLTLRNPQAEQMAMQLGLVPGQKNYTRFIILGRSRTGSNFLRGLLRDHPNIVTMGEILRNEDKIDWDSPHYTTNSQVLQTYQRTPVKFINQTVFRKFKPSIHAVGFKLFYYHARNYPFDAIWQALQEDADLHVIHIKRQNILRTHLSRAQAASSGNWVNISGAQEKQSAIFLDADACRADFEQTRQWEQEADQFFEHHPVLQVNYENLAEQTGAVIEQTQYFLELPLLPVKPQTYKQSQLPLSAAIQNYGELKQTFQGTPWAQFFDE